jgi:2'-5' RNA ligase
VKGREQFVVAPSLEAPVAKPHAPPVASTLIACSPTARVRSTNTNPCDSIVMARQLPAHLSHKSALALLPPASITAPIESIRRVHDKHFQRWPPHINLLYPFLASPSEVSAQGEGNESPQLKDSIRTRVQQAIKSIKPFEIALSADPPGTFSHSKKSKTVWLGPSSQSVQQLQAALQVEFTECNADPRPFTPHLSVGQAHSDDHARELGDLIRNSITAFANRSEGAPVALDWYVDKVFVIERKGFHGRFEIIGSIDIGTE